MQDNIRIEKERKFWDKLSPKYDEFVEKYWKIYKSSLLDKIADDISAGSTVLEVACGPGLVALKVAKKAKKVYGVDIAPLTIEEAKKKTRKMGIKNVEFSVEDAYALPFNSDMFDVAICNSSLHNMMEPQKALSEMKRVLKPGGMLIATVVGIGESSKFKIAMAIFKFITKFPAFHKLNLNEFAHMITESGFAVVNKEKIKHPEDRMPILYIVAERRE